MIARLLQLRSSQVALIGLLSALVFVLVAFSPVGLYWLASDQSIDWHRLADVGQAYGGASAMLSGFAVAGVVVSLALQWRQNRISQLHLLKQRHFDLIKLALEDPRFLYVEGKGVVADPNASLIVFANMLVSHWAMSWDLGALAEHDLRRIAKRLLSEEFVREWWKVYGISYLGSRRRHQFVGIIDEECSAAEQAAVNPDADSDLSYPTLDVNLGPRIRRANQTTRLAFLVASFVLGAACARALQVKKRRDKL